MTRIVIDAGLPDKLLALAQPAELCDANGRVVGQFFPQPNPAEYEGLEPPFSPEELNERRKLKGKRYTTAEVLAYLEKLQ